MLICFNSNIVYLLSSLGILPHHPDSEKFRGSPVQSHCSFQFPWEILRFTQTKNTTHQHHSRHRENIGRIGSLRVFWVISVIAVFPMKTGDSMFAGFDSQNTSHSFPHYPIWNLWIPGIPIIRSRDDSEKFRGSPISTLLFASQSCLTNKMMWCSRHGISWVPKI